MRLRNIPGSREKIADSQLTIDRPEAYKGKWKEIFGNDHPIRIEIGCGKGQFICQLAKENPDINYIGIEKFSSVLIRAIDKIEETLDTDRPITNVRFLRLEAEIITDVFEKGEVDRVYLNFSDPWPKARHAKRRLPSKEFLWRYKIILKEEGRVEFKTDNRELFDFALEEVEAGGFKMIACTFDLHKDEEMNRGNIMTEYEERFSAKGNPICKYILQKKPEKP
ncbi:MAG: tRNA (guanosine(46)-N7)-methyltransferase TrmB [Lachnospiraceae bacterium]|nr:tRNA (guanosine(46)-N7)-methyltransferase TrmB [Lachnospiraceae bacterium]